MAIDNIQSVTKAPAQAPPQPQARPAQAAPVQQPLPSRDNAVLSTEARGDTRIVPLAPGQKTTVVDDVETGAFEKLAHVANKVKMALLMPELAPDRVITGYAVAGDKLFAADGDFNVEVVPVEKDQDVMYYRGRRRAMASDHDTKSKFIPPQGRIAARSGVIEVEVSEDGVSRHPELKGAVKQVKQLLSEGKTPLLKIHGQWTFDSFHDGWVEIHPVEGMEILDPEAVPPVPNLPSVESQEWHDPNTKLHLNSLMDGYTLRTGATMGNGGGVSVGMSKDLFSFGSTPGYIGNDKGEILGYKNGNRGFVATDVTGILARDGNSALRVGGSIGYENSAWGSTWRAEAVGGEAFAATSDKQGPYVGGRVSYGLNIGPANSKMSLFVQVDKTIAKQGPVTGTVGLGFSF